MKLLLALVILTITIVNTFGQTRYEPFAQKPGSCSPALPVQICSRSCFFDSQCEGIGKCCPTSCGGFICSKPVTMRQPTQTENPGSCPATPTGRWVCSPTCSVDKDCGKTRKCCKNRCGALTCQKPDVETIEALEIPVVPLPEDRYDEVINPYNVPRNPYNVPRNPYNVPRNPYNVPENPYNVPRNPNPYPYYVYNNN